MPTAHRSAKQAGGPSACALLATAAAALAGLDAAAAAAHADAALGFLLRALDVRQRPPAALAAAPAPAAAPGAPEAGGAAGGVAAVEAAAVGALEALVMKLSEARFRPLFQRLLAWASAPPAADPGAPPCLGIAPCFVEGTRCKRLAGRALARLRLPRA